MWHLEEIMEGQLQSWFCRVPSPTERGKAPRWRTWLPAHGQWEGKSVNIAWGFPRGREARSEQEDQYLACICCHGPQASQASPDSSLSGHGRDSCAERVTGVWWGWWLLVPQTAPKGPGGQETRAPVQMLPWPGPALPGSPEHRHQPGKHLQALWRPNRGCFSLQRPPLASPGDGVLHSGLGPPRLLQCSVHLSRSTSSPRDPETYWSHSCLHTRFWPSSCGEATEHGWPTSFWEAFLCFLLVTWSAGAEGLRRAPPPPTRYLHGHELLHQHCVFQV